MRYRNRPCSLARQLLALRLHFPAVDAHIAKSCLSWEMVLQPTVLGEKYRVQGTLKIGKAPTVHVLSPALQIRDGKRPEHLYGDGSLCLYMPGWGEWNDRMLLVETIVPWTCDWLAHYEVWLTTGTWFGGGRHPPTGVPAQGRRGQVLRPRTSEKPA